jgi:hypothetical protein
MLYSTNTVITPNIHLEASLNHKLYGFIGFPPANRTWEKQFKHYFRHSDREVTLNDISEP